MENEEGKDMGKRGRLEDTPLLENEQIQNIKKRKITNEYNIQSQVLEDPICGLHYYRYLFGLLKTALQDGLAQFDYWDSFSEKFILTQEISDEWQKIASQIDMIQVAKEITKIIQKLEKLNCVRSHNDDLNENYFDLLRKEFTEFFDLETDFSSSSLKEEEPLYVGDDTISLESSKNALKWTAKEKDIFYESLARYGINRIDEIAALLPHKSQVDIINFYNILKKELKKYKKDKKLRLKLVSFDEMPKAFEVSEEYIKLEEQQASIIEYMENNSFGESPKLFNSNIEYDLVDFEGLEEKFNIKIGNDAAKKLVSKVIDYTKELIWQLYKKKLCEMSTALSYEWYNQLKAWENPPEPRNFVHVINLKDMTTYIDEEIDFDNIDMTDYDDNENSYLPTFTDTDLLLKEDEVIENSIEIPDNLDVKGLGITIEEVEEVTSKLLGSSRSISTRSVETEEPVSSLFVNDQPDSDGDNSTSSDTENDNLNETSLNLLSDVEDIHDLKAHTDAFEDLELNDLHYSQLFHETNFIIPFDEDYTVYGNEYLQKLLDNETERLEAIDLKDNELYELLLLTTLKQLDCSDRNDILEIISNIDNEMLHPVQKITTTINEKHSKKFMHLYNDY